MRPTVDEAVTRIKGGGGGGFYEMGWSLRNHVIGDFGGRDTRLGGALSTYQ